MARVRLFVAAVFRGHFLEDVAISLGLALAGYCIICVLFSIPD